MEYNDLIKKTKKELKEIAATVFLTVKSEWNKETIVRWIIERIKFIESFNSMN